MTAKYMIVRVVITKPDGFAVYGHWEVVSYLNITAGHSKVQYGFIYC